MNDAFHMMGGDLEVSATGDLRVASGTEAGQQRVLRRLLTNPGDYIWHLEYGAGVPRLVGDTATAAQVSAAIRGQMLLERGVSQSPEPVVDIEEISGGLTCGVRYNDAAGGTQVIGFNVTN